jgi:hypothetical protein
MHEPSWNAVRKIAREFGWMPEYERKDGEDTGPGYKVDDVNARAYASALYRAIHAIEADCLSEPLLAICGPLPTSPMRAASISTRRSGEKQMTEDRITTEAFLASRKAAGQVIDIEICEIGLWSAYTLDPYGVEHLPDEARTIGLCYFVRSAESDGWVCQCDLPENGVRALYERIERGEVEPMGDIPF